MKILKTTAIAILFMLLAIVTTATAGAEQYSPDAPMRFVRGVVVGYDGAAIIVNETDRVIVTDRTEFFNSRGKEIQRGPIRVGQWLYLEGYVQEDGSVDAEEVYFLPGNINKKDRSKYPFMKLP